MRKILAFIAFALCLAPNALACSCAEILPTQEALSAADLVFVGTCVSGELFTAHSEDIGEHLQSKYTFEVQKEWKGSKAAATIEIQTGIGGGDCGFGFNLGRSYLIYAYKYKDIYFTGICSRTRLAGYYPLQVEDRAGKEIERLDMLVKKE